jgi:sugar/nucleoside kinase (ribokinase family)
MDDKGDNDKLLIVGSIAFDSVETPVGKVERAMGGSASYASIAASYWCQPLAVGIVGDDFGDHHFKRLEDHGVDIRGIEKVAGQTFHWRGRYHENFKERDTLETALNVFESFDPQIPDEYKRARYVFLGNIDPELQMRVLSQMSSTDLVAMDTMNFWIDTARSALDEVISRVDLLFINDEEALQLSGQSSIPDAVDRILTMGPKYLVVKRGEHGALLFGPENRLTVPAVPLESIVDPTGAGDTFAGGFMGCLAGDGGLDWSSMASAILDGTVIASFAVQAFSVDGISNLSKAEIDSRRTKLERTIGDQ